MMIIGVKNRIFALTSVAIDGAWVIVGRSAPTVASAFATGTVMAFRSSQPFSNSTISVWHVIEIELGGGGEIEVAAFACSLRRDFSSAGNDLRPNSDHGLSAVRLRRA